MKVSFLMPFLHLYGAVRTMVDLSNEMVERGHSVTMYHGKGGPCDWLEVKAETKPKKAILETKHEVVIANLRGVVGLLQSCRAKLKLYLLADRWGEFDSSYQSMLRSNWVKLAATKWSQRWLAERGVVSYYLPPGVNREIFYPVKTSKKYGLRLLCTGDKRPGKGLVYVNTTVDILRNKYGLDVVLSNYEGKGLPQSEMAQVYGEADMFVDMQGGDAALKNNPVVEAMACGTPVVCLDHESVSEWAFHRQTAILVPEQNPALVAEAIVELNSNKDLMERIRTNALKKVSEFTWVRTAERLEKIIAMEMKRV